MDFFNLFPNLKGYSNLPLYQSGSGGEEAIFIDGQEDILVLSTDLDHTLLAQVMDKEKLRNFIETYETDDEWIKDALKDLLEGKVHFNETGNAFLSVLDELLNREVIYAQAYLDEVEEDEE